jgi:hypothetical protein
MCFLRQAERYTILEPKNECQKEQPVNAVYGDNHCLMWEWYGAHKYTVWAEYRVCEC